MSIPSENLMTLNVAAIKAKSPDLAYLQGQVRYHIGEIERGIKNAIMEKNGNLKYNIQQNFEVQFITNAAAQRYVYATVISQLQMNGFEVRLTMVERENSFHITWISGIDRSEIEHQNQLIRNATQRS